ncbi:cytochrome c oxidase subunit I [Bacillus solimangrovi]|uniref:Cytochrome c oxidase subunit 1 n=1 Tax=Bacillus solimangrovi TaxID=1305675 RepID=A0A1E5LFJ8_9BACI|nr:cytochrome c oxidase subunit I [Bacillus solimangrovi]OEH92857.1 cytochrome c oxidase subunit I [Bacillus solimangrovi]
MTTQVKKKSIFWDYLTTVDHKKIAHLYLFAGLFFFVLAGLEAILMRIQLMYPSNTFVSAGFYNQLLTMHGTTMLFLAATPILFAFMNAIIPLQIGARDVAFPFLNSLGFWLFLFGGILLNLSWFLGGAPNAGWTSYSTLALEDSTHGTEFYIVGLQISGLGTLISAINILTTVINMRAPGMTYMRMPLFVWSSFVSSALILFAFPPLTVALFLLLFDRLFGGNFFSAELGGNSIIWEHIFWVFGHPEVYLLVLPAFGIISEIIPTFSRKRLFGYSAMVFATVLIGFVGFMVWAHHMFTTGMGAVPNSIFALATMLVAIPTGIKVFNWLFTMWGGQLRFEVPMLWAVWFLVSFVMGGVTGVMTSSAPADYQYHDTYFIVAHFHYVILGGVVFPIFGGLHYWWPKMFGKMLNETLGKWTFWTFFIGFHMTFFIQHFLGLWGMPRRIFTFLPNQGLDLGNFISSIGSFIMGIGAVLLVINIIITSVKDEKTKEDPWDGRSLEWAISSPPPEYNFKQLPLVKTMDPWWDAKYNNKGKISPAEPVGDIHMPNSSFIPFIISFGLFIAGLSLIYINDNNVSLFISIIGLLVTFGAMLARSIQNDYGYHIHKEDQHQQDLYNKG